MKLYILYLIYIAIDFHIINIYIMSFWTLVQYKFHVYYVPLIIILLSININYNYY